MGKVSGIGMKVGSGASSRSASGPLQAGAGGAGKGTASSLGFSLDSLNAATSKKTAGNVGTKINKYA